MDVKMLEPAFADSLRLSVCKQNANLWMDWFWSVYAQTAEGKKIANE